MILRGTFRRKSQLWDNAHTLNLENCLLYLSSMISQFLDFIHWMVFAFSFLLPDNDHTLFKECFTKGSSNNVNNRTRLVPSFFKYSTWKELWKTHWSLQSGLVLTTMSTHWLKWKGRCVTGNKHSATWTFCNDNPVTIQTLSTWI